MSKLAWKPWHKVVDLRDDVRTGELSLSIFAADLYDVMMGKARPVYQNPYDFFSLTYPTFNLRELAKDVVVRLSGKNDKAVRQLELTYGGGKTHTLITLYHLVNDPEHLPDLPAVDQFRTHIGVTPPKTRVAMLPFDKLDVEKGMEVRGPDHETRWLRNPWSVVAYQIAGSYGLQLLHAQNEVAERESAPAENLLTELLAIPGKDRLSTLLLIDEVLMYAREKVRQDPTWRASLANFFQYLTQAATKVDHCGVVASLLATDPRKSDAIGKELTQELYAIFRREREEGVQPVVKEDVAELLRRRFFKPKSIKDREAFRPHVTAALGGITDLDDQTRRDAKAAEERFVGSYPFHPDLTDVFYTKWTQLEGFQRTRGILRTFALALRDAEKWDDSPLIGPNVFLCRPGQPGISEAARELTNTATTEEYEGKRQEWSAILQGELEKARTIQDEFPALRHREIEQAVFATFLHSQPIGQRALTRDLVLLLGDTRPDKIELEKALRRWTEVSWFLDEAGISDAEVGPDGIRQLPKSWRLGSRPNLRQMHHDAINRVMPDVVERILEEEISKAKSLSAGASSAGARVHALPLQPRDIDDDGEFHYAILGPKAASDSGKPSAEAKRFLNETTSPDRPRVYRNAVVLAVPSIDGLEAARNQIRDYLGWTEVQAQLKGQEIDAAREQMLNLSLNEAKKKIPVLVQQAYSLVVTVSDRNEVEAFRVAPGTDPLFNRIKADTRSRIQETAVTADALLPGGPYDLWREGETSRRVKDLVDAFAQFPQLPKMLNRKAILDTLVHGCEDGLFVLLLRRPDGSIKTFWRQRPDEVALKEPALEIVLPEAATLTELPPRLLVPSELPGLWATDEITVRDVRSYFAGGNVVQVRRGDERLGYEEPFVIPKVEPEIVDEALGAAVVEGKLWLVSGSASILGEEIPPGLLMDDAILQAPPKAVSPLDLMPQTLPEAWSGRITTAVTLAIALSKKVGKPLPWKTVQSAIGGAFNSRLLERTPDSGEWPCDYGGAQSVRLQVPDQEPPPPPPPGRRIAEADLESYDIQELAEHVGDLGKAAAGHSLTFRLRVALGGDAPPPEKVVDDVNSILRQIREDFQLR